MTTRQHDRHEEHAEEAERRWGRTEAYGESQRRVATYKEEDWQRLEAEEKEVRADLAAALAAGLAPESEEAMAAAEAHRRLIGRWFYDCTYEIHRGLTDAYVSDERFRAQYEATAPGLASFIREATHANAAMRADR